MKDLNDEVFIELFKQACKKCFGFTITSALSEPDSRQLSNKILEETGLVIGVKSIRNYSLYIINREGKENPSASTLDTLARYVLNAPHTTETHRKLNEAHHPYWFQFRSQYSTSKEELPPANASRTSTRRISIIGGAVIVIGLVVLITTLFIREKKNENFVENFNSVNEDSLRAKGWTIQNIDTAVWSRRNEKDGHLTLLTLRGDNWAGGESPAGIKNLLVKEVDDECFAVEVHFTDFIPRHNWQQAGILISETSDFSGKVIRLSVSYNDFFGGFEKAPEIIVQGLSSSEAGDASKPEEFSHFTVFNFEPDGDDLIKNNLAKSGLKIEKKGSQFRFLFISGSTDSFAFKEIARANYSLRPKYIGIFAIQGFSETEDRMAVAFDSFRTSRIDCSE